jgi:hypothetical protein
MVDEQPPHRLRSEREAVGATLPLVAALLLQAQPRLVDERRWLERVVSALTRQISAGYATQFAVNERKELSRRTRTLA